ncbi:IS1182 family transposase [Robertmurraya kyonggiensis]|uniref:IS1182 family transposase n=1 Tax=Robertmurraya kyonggiensis TaxID=1037680 RepID=A0A4U1CV64_9BACI|nr:IS1182 family transposase [Robertmurraya kyonggiensis]
MLKNKNTQLSIYSLLYDKIPKNHTLKLLIEAIDFSFFNDLLEHSFNKYYGRPSIEPELMVKILILQRLYDLSDERVIAEASLNLAYMYFLGIDPDDTLPDPSLLAKFRTTKLEEAILDDMIIELIKQCVEKNIISDTGVSIDSTHSSANTGKLFPEKVMSRLAKKIFKTAQEEEIELPDTINQEIPDTREIKDPKEANEKMKNYLEETISSVESIPGIEQNTQLKEVLENAKEIIEDPKFMEFKGVRSLVDQEARVGYKSKTDNFFGYKMEYMISTENRMITAVRVHNGAYVDGTRFEELLELTKKSLPSITEVYGDKAYFKKAILDKIVEIEATPYIPVSESAYRIDEEQFSYNKDSDQWFCAQGNQTTTKKHYKRKCGKQSYNYYFELEKCRNCPVRDLCIPSNNTVRKVLAVGINTPEFYEYSQQQKNEEFKEKYKKRACQEWKNGEMKNFHGLNRAKGYGLKSMSIQAKLTALAVNLKRIAGILSSKAAI